MGGRSAAGCLWAAVSFAVGAGALVPATSAAAKLSAGVGQGQRASYAVGMRSYTFIDRSRPTPPNGPYRGAGTRTLPTLLLYPATGRRNGPAVKNATPFPRGHGFPLIVFSHGFTATGPAFSVLLERFVREGYVVAAPTFPLSSPGAAGGPTTVDYVNQPGDVSFVLTSVLRLARRDRSLRRTIDPRHVGAFGHSLGATTTLGVATNSCCLDHRISGAVSFAGNQLPFAGGDYFSAPTVPLMLVHGTADQAVPYGASVAAYQRAPAPKVFLTLTNAMHVPFEPPWLEPTIRSITDFLDGFLKCDRHAVRRLAIDGNVPGVTSVQQVLHGFDRRQAKC